jgi:serine/threonine protein phosphatase PrpC
MFAFSITPKKTNEDFFETIKTPLFEGVIVADGLGSYSKAKEASTIVVLFVKEQLKSLDSSVNIEDSIYQIFHLAQEELYKIAKIDSSFHEYATTLLLALKLDKEIVIAYLGNGAIFHIRNNIAQCKTNNLLSWAITNYLIPHTVKNSDGKEALYRYLSAKKSSDSNIVKPTILKIQREYNGSSILLCSDGFYSIDQLQIGKINKTDNRLAIYDKSYSDILEIFECFYGDKKFALKERLEEYFIQHKDSLDDDMTMAILIDD